MTRQSKYHTHVEPRLIEIEGWARDGLIDKQIEEGMSTREVKELMGSYIPLYKCKRGRIT